MNSNISAGFSEGLRIANRQTKISDSAKYSLILYGEIGIFFVQKTAHSSSGLGRRPLTPVTRVRLPYALPPAPVAQLDRVLGYGPRGCGFDSLRAYHLIDN